MPVYIIASGMHSQLDETIQRDDNVPETEHFLDATVRQFDTFDAAATWFSILAGNAAYANLDRESKR